MSQPYILPQSYKPGRGHGLTRPDSDAILFDKFDSDAWSFNFKRSRISSNGGSKFDNPVGSPTITIPQGSIRLSSGTLGASGRANVFAQSQRTSESLFADFIVTSPSGGNNVVSAGGGTAGYVRISSSFAAKRINFVYGSSDGNTTFNTGSSFYAVGDRIIVLMTVRNNVANNFAFNVTQRKLITNGGAVNTRYTNSGDLRLQNGGGTITHNFIRYSKHPVPVEMGREIVKSPYNMLYDVTGRPTFFVGAAPVSATASPSGIQTLGRQYATISASKLGGVLQ